ncbi:MAG TPA: hypothetical protein VFE32_19320 [Puia sp.]|jgi:hypothetical protein|nr:hypothetical protein [Puia sp.]
MDSNNSTLAVWQLISTIGLGLLTILTYFRIARLSTKTNAFGRLDDELNNIVKTWVKYPILEDDEFIESCLTDKAEKTDKLRYDAYCTLNFNYIESLYKYFKGSVKRMARYSEYEEMILTHKEWWKKNQSNSLTAYKGKFTAFVEKVIQASR